MCCVLFFCCCNYYTFIVFFQAYRRTVEIFAESIPQTMLQGFILWYWSINDKKNIDSDAVTDLILSIVTSFLNLGLNFYHFRNESKFHGMSLSEYALSVLQLSEIPIVKMVPRLPAIKNGEINNVNLSSFKLDRESFAPLLDAITNRKCCLNSIKISLGSLINLDIHTCKMLANLLHSRNISVIASRLIDSKSIKTLFKTIDLDKNGYVDRDEVMLYTVALIAHSKLFNNFFC